MKVIISGNTLVILAVLTSHSLRSVTSLLITSLAVADLMVGVLVIPFSIANQVCPSPPPFLVPLGRTGGVAARVGVRAGVVPDLAGAGRVDVHGFHLQPRRHLHRALRRHPQAPPLPRHRHLPPRQTRRPQFRLTLPLPLPLPGQGWCRHMDHQLLHQLPTHGLQLARSLLRPAELRVQPARQLSGLYHVQTPLWVFASL